MNLQFLAWFETRRDPWPVFWTGCVT